MRLAKLFPILLAACGGTIDSGDGSAPTGSCQHSQPKAEQCNGLVVQINSDPSVCGVPADAGYGVLPDDVCTNLCGAGHSGCEVASTDGRLVRCIPVPCTGRRPAGLIEKNAPSNISGYFAWMSALEAASVHSFRVLENDLREHGAPERLIAASRRAARDETRHARMTARLAKRFGRDADAPAIRLTGDRTLEEIAVENAVEGCVRETWGALVGAFQGQNAGISCVRKTFERLARDEVRHAELSWNVHAWIMQRLDASARERVRNAMRGAIATLERDTRIEPPGELVREAGVPHAAAAHALLRGLASHVWKNTIA